MDTEKPDAAIASSSPAVIQLFSQADRAYALAAKRARQSNDGRKMLSKREFWNRVGPDGRTVLREFAQGFNGVFDGAWEEAK